MRFIVVVALVALFAFAVAEVEKEKEEKEEVEVHEDIDEEEDAAVDSPMPSALSSAMQFKGNNIGDINTLKVNFDGELNNVMSQDILNIMVALLNQQKIIENHGAEDVDGDSDEDEGEDEHHDKEKKDDDDKKE
ncbi:unnamed protein product [Diamesa hyperborea]